MEMLLYQSTQFRDVKKILAREAVRAVQDLFYVAKLRALVKKHLHRVIPPVGSERFLL